MGKENNINKTWKGKLLDQYRMIIVNEKTFEEQFYFRLSRLNLIILLILLISSIMTGTFFLISSTPVKEFIPGYPSSELRLEAIKNTFLLDSIIDITKKQDKFLESIKSALLGENDETIIEEYKSKINLNESLLYFVKSNEKRHNIFGLWSVKLIDTLEKDLVDNNYRKVEKWADKIGVKIINIKNDKFDSFFNINTKADLEDANKLLKEYKND